MYSIPKRKVDKLVLEAPALSAVMMGVVKVVEVESW